MRLLRLLAGLAPLALPFATAPAAEAAPDGFSVMTFVCPSPFQVNFSWTPATNATSYALQLVGPIDPGVNGGVRGTYVPQFGTIEVAKGPINSASVSLNAGALQGTISEEWQIMLGGANGYMNMVPRSQVAIVPVPCNQTAPLQSPNF